MKLFYILLIIAIILLLKYYVNRTFLKLEKENAIIEHNQNYFKRMIYNDKRVKIEDQDIFFMTPYNVIKKTDKQLKSNEILMINYIYGHYNRIEYETLKEYINTHHPNLLNGNDINILELSTSTLNKSLYFVKYTNHGMVILMFIPNKKTTQNSDNVTYSIRFIDITGNIIIIHKSKNPVSDKDAKKYLINECPNYVHDDLDELNEQIIIPIMPFNRNSTKTLNFEENDIPVNTLEDIPLYLYNVSDSHILYEKDKPIKIYNYPLFRKKPNIIKLKLELNTNFDKYSFYFNNKNIYLYKNEDNENNEDYKYITLHLKDTFNNKSPFDKDSYNIDKLNIKLDPSSLLKHFDIYICKLNSIKKDTNNILQYLIYTHKIEINNIDKKLYIKSIESLTKKPIINLLFS